MKKTKEQITYNFRDLSFNFPDYSIKLNKYIIPVKLKIENIKMPKYSELDISYIEDEYLGFEFRQNKEIQAMRDSLIHINTEDKLFNNFKQTFLQYHNLKSIDEVLEYLDIADMYAFNKSISSKIPFMIKIFRDRLYNSLKLDIEPPRIDYKSKHEKPENIKEYLQYTENYIFLQSLIEYSSEPFFSENLNKTPDEWSLREYETRMAYLTAKNRFDSTENLWQMKSMDTKDK